MAAERVGTEAPFKPVTDEEREVKLLIRSAGSNLPAARTAPTLTELESLVREKDVASRTASPRSRRNGSTRSAIRAAICRLSQPSSSLTR